MTRLALPFLSLAILLSLLERGSAGPACARRNYQAGDCITKCGQMWGWPGNVMGQDPWGAVIKGSQSADMDSIISQACGISTTDQSSSSMTATQTVMAVPSQVTSVSSTSVPATLTVPASSSSTVLTSSSVFSNTTSSTSTEFSSSSSSIRSPKTASSTVGSSSAHVNQAIAASSSTFSKSVKPTTSTTPVTPKTTSTSSSTAKATSSSSKPSSSSLSSSSTPAGSNAGSGTTSSSDINQYLTAHNTVRAQHGASALTWSDNLASKAQQWANGCVFQHSGGSLGPFGENLAAGTGDSYDITAAVKSWTDEVSEYNANDPVASHFTQVVWKASTQVGCALQLCDGIFSASFGKAKFYVCEYSPQGNVVGEFAQNVQV